MGGPLGGGGMMHRPLPHECDRRVLVFAATGTKPIFNHGPDLPGVASFALVRLHPGLRVPREGCGADMRQMAERVTT